MNEILTIKEARSERDKMAEKIAILIGEYERISKLRIDSVQITRGDKKTKIGTRYSSLSVLLAVRLRDGE